MYSANGNYIIRENFDQLSILSEEGNITNKDRSKQVQNSIPLGGSNLNPTFSNTIVPRTSPINPISNQLDYMALFYWYCINDTCYTKEDIKKLLKYS